MSYGDWRKEMLQVGDAGTAARIANLESESRIDGSIAAFKDVVVGTFLLHCGGGSAPLAALTAFQDAVTLTKPVVNSWVALLPLPAGASIPSLCHTHMLAEDISRFNMGPAFDPDVPPPQLTLTRKPGTRETGVPIKTFLWVTFEDGAALPDDPTQLVIELGLPHFWAGAHVYRIPIPLPKDGVCIPTCFDAQLYEAWAPPPSGHAKPWGMTRNLTTGVAERPELVVKVEALTDTPLTAHLLKGQIGAYRCDFMIGRA